MMTRIRLLFPLVVTSPLAFGVFLIIPLVVVLQRISGGSSISPIILLINNLLCLAWLLARLFIDVRRFRSGKRYGSEALFRGRAATVPFGREQLREHLVRTGYILDESGRYGERPDRGYWGRLLLLTGLSFTLLVGTYDNVRQFSGTILLGVGGPLKLFEASSYGILTKGALSSFDELPVKLQITRQILPDGKYPKGATDIVICDPDGKELQRATIRPGSPLSIGAFEIHMARFLFDAWLVVTTTSNHIVFTNFVKLLPLDKPKEGYTFHGEIDDDHFEKVKGEVWLRPQDKAMKVAVDYKGSRIVDTELFLWGENKKESAGYVAKLEGLGQWSEIHVTRRRHKSALFAGVWTALLGLLIRLSWRPRRVWITETPDGISLRTTDAKVLKAINDSTVDI
ncbi:ResB-like family cytochrome c biogenesis protein, putative [Geotalea daltonii FRC-32]|uniref:ResB-like family cytochrome c biogenesis protein, putative n=1 Tax=Geotalea daltonii (strain DSM 22248 / JCM 15807 / FRC-32) TaxID=316067 RepID=B9M7X3_GEODF|nr:cytochrome c biogenesis protein [Geotalea daltonii]ACM18431.1 ResB-like family cytochrome c biogenesis protein, putative [Geotalea daltonii FRC-32]